MGQARSERRAEALDAEAGDGGAKPMTERYNIRMYKYCPKCRTSEYKSDVGAWVKYEDHAAEVELLKAEAETYRAMARKYAQNVQGLLNERRRGDVSTIQDLMEPKP
jgi:hypothetical protein